MEHRACAPTRRDLLVLSFTGSVRHSVLNFFRLSSRTVPVFISIADFLTEDKNVGEWARPDWPGAEGSELGPAPGLGLCCPGLPPTGGQ